MLFRYSNAGLWQRSSTQAAYRNIELAQAVTHILLKVLPVSAEGEGVQGQVAARNHGACILMYTF